MPWMMLMVLALTCVIVGFALCRAAARADHRTRMNDALMARPTMPLPRRGEEA
jgi:hypothetical protein